MHAGHWGRGRWTRWDPVLGVMRFTVWWWRRLMSKQKRSMRPDGKHREHITPLTVHGDGSEWHRALSEEDTFKIPYKGWVGVRWMEAGDSGGKREKGTCVHSGVRENSRHFRNWNKLRMGGAEKTRRSVAHSTSGEVRKGQIPWSPQIMMRS